MSEVNHLSLIKTEVHDFEKRVFPRFPFGFLVFKANLESYGQKVFSVKDVSLTGMQLSIDDNVLKLMPNLKLGQRFDGNLHWRGANLILSGFVQWIHDDSIGLSFDSSIALEKKLKDFFSLDHVLSHLRPMHDNLESRDLPQNLKYWFKSDGVLEIFVWNNEFGVIAHFQIIFMDHFLEWTYSNGMKTGRVMTQRSLETPLSDEGEFTFQMDAKINMSRIELARGLFDRISPQLFLDNDLRIIRDKIHG